MSNPPFLDKAAYTVPEAARQLSVSRKFLYDLMRRGDLSYTVIGTVRRIPRSEIIRLSGN